MVELATAETAEHPFMAASDTPPLRHIARALVFDPQDRLLLIAYEAERPIDPSNPDARTFWFMPGGGLEPGESHVEACRRELGEEIGVFDAEIGPQVGACDGPFFLFPTPRDARERYFVVRLPDDRVDTSRLAETEDSKVLGTRWWTVDELETGGERIEPAGLVSLVRRIVGDDLPASPVNLSWHRAGA
ncbi:RNA pyrophosphohydrolase [Methylobacterium marchantiae]|nr:RNA pyrophosphohydrolase [Methylobacterium marchantiae]